MSSKQSCFKTIVKCDLKRSWWIGALAALFIFMATTSPMFNYLNMNDFYSYRRYDGMLNFCNMMAGNYAIGICVSAFAVLYLFSYVNKVNSVSYFHSLPSTRNTLMTAHLLSASVIVAFPMLINMLISFFAVGNRIKASWILMSFVIYMVYSFVVLSLTLVITMLTGVSIAGGIFTGVAALLPLFVFAFIQELCETYFYGYAGGSALEDFLINYIYLSPEKLMTPSILIYIALIAAFIGISFFVYNKRNLENFGEVIAFPGLKGLFEVLFAVCTGVLGYYYFEAFWGVTSILTMLAAGSLGVVIAHMIANRSLTLKGALKPFAATIGLVVLIFVVFFFDIFSFETRVPDADDIEYATIGGVYHSDYTYVDSEINGQGSIRVTKLHQYKPFYTSKEDIGNFLKLHKYAVENRSQNDNCGDDFFVPKYLLTSRENVQISYKLKNGKTMKRDYYLPKADLDRLTYGIYNSEVYKKWRYPVIDETPKTYKRLEIYDDKNYHNDSCKILFQSDEELGLIVEALKKDKKSIPYEVMQIKGSGSLVRLNIIYTMTYVSEDGREYEIEHSDFYSIDEYDVNTWALLEKYDFFKDEKKLEAENVKTADIYINEYHAADDDVVSNEVEYYVRAEEQVTVEPSYVYDLDLKYINKNGYIELTDRNNIETVYNLFMIHENKYISDDVNYYILSVELGLDNDTRRTRNIRIAEEDIPENLIEIITVHKNNMF